MSNDAKVRIPQLMFRWLTAIKPSGKDHCSLDVVEASNRNVVNHIARWLSGSEPLMLPLRMKGQQYGNMEEAATIARASRKCLEIWCGDHRQTPGGLQQTNLFVANLSGDPWLCAAKPSMCNHRNLGPLFVGTLRAPQDPHLPPSPAGFRARLLLMFKASGGKLLGSTMNNLLPFCGWLPKARNSLKCYLLRTLRQLEWMASSVGALSCRAVLASL